MLIAVVTSHLHVDVSEQLDEVVHIADVRDVVNRHRLTGQQRSTDDLKCFVLGALWCDGSA